MSKRLHQEISLPSVLTTTVWASCLLIGFIGFVFPYARATFAAPAQVPMQAEMLNVELTNEPLPPDTSPPPPDVLTPPPTLEAIAPPPSPPALIPVAAPAPTIAFALPVAGPTRIVAAAEPSYKAPVPTAAQPSNTQVPVTPLTFGQGEGKQPEPTYPARAVAEGQEGFVRVLFTVGPDGRTLAADLAVRCPWPLLNEAALKIIREKWRFKPGPVRCYEVPIQFKIKK